MSRAVLSEQAQMSEYFLGEVERGEKMPSVTYLRNLCYVLGISLDELLCLPPQKKNKNKHYYKYNYTPEMHKSQHVTKFQDVFLSNSTSLDFLYKANLDNI